MCIRDRVKSDSSEHGSPTYRVMLLAKYLGNDTVKGQSLNGQYITLAARESIVTESPVTFNLNSLPSDAMTNYTDFLVVAVPVTSGKGDMKYRWDATEDEVSAAIASHASETNDTNKEIWWKNGYEIVRTGEHSYTYAHLTPLCFSDVSRTVNTDDKEWAIQATQTTPQIIFKQLNPVSYTHLKYVLDSTKPAQPGDIQVKASQVQDADNNVYGRYEVTWAEPSDSDKNASPAAYYRVEILPCDAAGKVASDAVPYLKADVYQRSYTFVADKAWTGYFVVRVTPYNTNNDSTQVDNSRTSAVQTFMHALPTPEIELDVYKRQKILCFFVQS